MASLPRHIGVIMDGNGRWAKGRGLPRLAGHREGGKAVRRFIEAAAKAKIEFITLYSFSTENWSRPLTEIDGLKKLLTYYLQHEVEEIHRRGARLNVIGEIDVFGEELAKSIKAACHLTQNNRAITVTLALNYGSQQEIVRSARLIAEKVQQQRLSLADIDQACLAKHFFDPELPLLDLLIRTGGEHRLSNFLLWQAAYAELYFTDLYWPDFDEEHLALALQEFAKRQRRFGGLTAPT